MRSFPKIKPSQKFPNLQQLHVEDDTIVEFFLPGFYVLNMILRTEIQDGVQDGRKKVSFFCFLLQDFN